MKRALVVLREIMSRPGIRGQLSDRLASVQGAHGLIAETAELEGAFFDKASR